MPRPESLFAACIRVAPAWRPAYDVRHVEAVLRLWHASLDGLDIGVFAVEVGFAIDLIDAVGAAESEALALAFGL